MKKFCIWKSTGQPEIIQANGITFKKTADGLSVRFKIGRSVAKRDGVVALVEVSPPIKIETRKQTVQDEEQFEVSTDTGPVIITP